VTAGEEKDRRDRRSLERIPHERGRGVVFVDMGESNLARHPVRAVLSKAQRR